MEGAVRRRIRQNELAKLAGNTGNRFSTNSLGCNTEGKLDFTYCTDANVAAKQKEMKLNSRCSCTAWKVVWQLLKSDSTEVTQFKA